MGSVIKVHAIYEEPFWRREGLSGFVLSDSGPVRVVYDNSPEDGSPGVLVGFIEGEEARTWARRAPAGRRAGVLACLADYFGERAGRPRELLERSSPRSSRPAGSGRRPGRTGSAGRCRSAARAARGRR
jgi:monoamine oxidase